MSFQSVGEDRQYPLLELKGTYCNLTVMTSCLLHFRSRVLCSYCKVATLISFSFVSLLFAFRGSVLVLSRTRAWALAPRGVSTLCTFVRLLSASVVVSTTLGFDLLVLSWVSTYLLSWVSTCLLFLGFDLSSSVWVSTYLLLLGFDLLRFADSSSSSSLSSSSPSQPLITP